MAFFDIDSVCVVGASESKGKIGNDLLKNLQSFDRKIYAINPKGGSFGSIHFLKNFLELPEVPDVAVFAIPEKFVYQALEECGQVGIKKAIIISAGFKEVGNIKGEEKIQSIAKKYGIAVMGPNCLGYIDTNKNLNLSFGGKDIKAGDIALVSQSGAMAVAFTDWAYEYNIGFSKIISLGNKSDLNENDFLIELVDDPDTSVIALYLESIEHGKEFYDLCSRLSKKKPIVLVKSGISSCGSKAAASHTGALMSPKEILETAFTHSGVHSTHSLEEFFLWAQALSETKNIEIPEDITIITNAGGPGVMTTDHIEGYNLSLHNFTQSEKEILKQGMPDAACLHNPIDIIGDATSQRYKTILENMSTLKNKGAIYILLTPQTSTDVDNITQVIIDFKNTHPEILILCSFMGNHSLKKAREKLEAAGVLHYDTPKKGISSFSCLKKQAKWESTDVVTLKNKLLSPLTQEIKKSLQGEEGTLCSQDITSKILQQYDITGIPNVLIDNRDMLRSLSSLNYPLIAKIESPDIAHKSDVGGIISDITDPDSALKAYESIMQNIQTQAPAAQVSGVLFQEQIQSGHEVFVGCKRDPNFGDILVIGKGGIYVNVYNDVSRRLFPVDEKDIESMLQELTIYPILSGIRGQPSIDFKKLISSIHKITVLFQNEKNIKEIDINPIIAHGNGSYLVDGKFYL